VICTAPGRCGRTCRVPVFTIRAEAPRREQAGNSRRASESRGREMGARATPPWVRGCLCPRAVIKPLDRRWGRTGRGRLASWACWFLWQQLQEQEAEKERLGSHGHQAGPFDRVAMAKARQLQGAFGFVMLTTSYSWSSSPSFLGFAFLEMTRERSVLGGGASVAELRLHAC
jgi:hypothetical protein